MSVKELTDRLKEKGESPENAEDAAAWLQELHLLDDAQYAAMCVRHYAAKGYGAGRIRSELYRRGIPRELWDDALQELPEQDDQIDTLLRRRLRSDTPTATNCAARRTISTAAASGATRSARPSRAIRITMRSIDPCHIESA